MSYLLLLFLYYFFDESTILTNQSVRTLSPACGNKNVQANFGTNTNVPQNPCVPTLAYDQTSLFLVWNKPDNYNAIVDYNVYMNGKKLGNAKGNALATSPAAPYINAFYAQDKANFHAKISYHTYLVQNLTPNTVYRFTVRSVNNSGQESADSAVVVHKTAPAYSKIIDITKMGAKGDGSTLNTKAIQNAIDQCAANSMSAYGCKVLIPANQTGKNTSANVFVTGGLLLRSNMTIEVAQGATLKASSNSTDFPLINETPLSLLHAINNSSSLVNIRVIGKGTLDGTGWIRSATDTIDELGNALANFKNSSSSTWATQGILARSQMEAAAAEVGGTLNSTMNTLFYANRRSSLLTIENTTNAFVGDIQLTNPAFHGIRFLRSKNVVCANTITETYDINNADGIQSTSVNTLIFNNFVDSGDDCIVFKAGQGQAMANRTATQYGWVFNNYLREGHGAVVCGSETSAWIRDILAEDNVAMFTENGMRLKTTPQTGGGVELYVFRDSAMREIGTNNLVVANGQVFNRTNVVYTSGTQCGFILSMTYSLGSTNFVAAKISSRFRNIFVQHVTLDNGNASTGGPMISVTGYDGQSTSLPYPKIFHENVTFVDVNIANAKPANISRLRNSHFQNMRITNWGTTVTNPWLISNSSNLTFVNVSPMPPGF